MKPVDCVLWTAVAALAVAAGFSAAALAETGKAETEMVAVALGAAASLLPFVILVPVTTWRRFGMAMAFHGSVWTVSLAGSNPALVFGLSTALLVGAASRQLWSGRGTVGYARISDKGFS